MKTTVFLILLFNSFTAFSYEDSVFGEWFVKSAICTVDGSSAECPNLNEKITITKRVSGCGSLQINISAIEVGDIKSVILNSCGSSTQEVNLSPTDNGYRYYSIENLVDRTDIVLSRSAGNLEIYISSSTDGKAKNSKLLNLADQWSIVD